MKYLKKILLFVLFIGIIVGCQDVIDLTQKGTLPPDQTFKTVADLEKGLLGVYIQLDIFEEIWFSAVFTDEISIGTDNGGQGLSLYSWTLTSESIMPAHTWASTYDAINKATRFIIAARKIDPPDDLQNKYDQIVGQAHAIRAYEYFNLLKYFSADITDNSSLGVITFKGIPPLEAELPRSTTGEVFQFINADLDTAKTLIPSSFDDAIHFTQAAITALQARMALYHQDYAAAEQFSQQILDQMSLASPQEYKSMYLQGTRGEVIFKLQRTPGDSYDQQAPLLIASGHGWIGNVFAQVDYQTGQHFEVSRSLYNMIDEDDVRLNIISAPTSTIVEDYSNLSPGQFLQQDINSVYKYKGYEIALLADQIVFRVSEMVLINAEAKAAQGNLGGAAEMIDLLRDARYTANDPPMPVYSTKEEAFTDILAERRIELAYEGHRWFDLRRIGPKIGAEIDRAPIDCELEGACDGPVPGESYKYVLPIPSLEFNANNNITQNPGYGGGNGAS